MLFRNWETFIKDLAVGTSRAQVVTLLNWFSHQTAQRCTPNFFLWYHTGCVRYIWDRWPADIPYNLKESNRMLGSPKFPSPEGAKNTAKGGPSSPSERDKKAKKYTAPDQRGNSNNLAPSSIIWDYTVFRGVMSIPSPSHTLTHHQHGSFNGHRQFTHRQLGQKEYILLHDLFPQIIFEAPPVPVPTVRYTPAVSLCAVTNTTKSRSAYHCHGLHCDGDISRSVKTFVIKKTNSSKENHIPKQLQTCEEGSRGPLWLISGPSRPL